MATTQGNAGRWVVNGRWLGRVVGLALVGLLTLVSPASAARPPQPATERPAAAFQANDLWLYRDSLEPGWEDWSWSATRDFGATPGQGGSGAALRVTLTNWGGLSLRRLPFDASPYTHLEFYVRGESQGGQSLRVFLQDANSNEIGSAALENPQYIAGGAVTTQWQLARIPLADLNAYARPVMRVNWQGQSQASPPTFWLDGIRLVAAPAVPLTATLRPSQVVGSIPATVFGTNAAWWNGNIHQSSDDVAKIRASGVSVLRFPGGSSSNTYHWRQHEPLLGGGPDWELGFSEFVSLARQVGAEPMITVNFGTGTAAEAADWVRWANVEQGYGIKYWEIGNEIYGSWEQSWTHNGLQYCTGDTGHDGFNAFVQAMKAVDPTIKIGAIGVDSPNTPDNSDPAWGPHVLQACQGMDFYIIHIYAFGPGNRDYAGLLAHPPQTWPAIKGRLDAMFQAAGKVVPVAVTEYNSYYTEPEALAIQTVNTLFLADTLGQIVSQGFPMANHWDILNGLSANGGDYGYLLGDPGHPRQASYYAFPIWRRAGDQLVSLTTNANAVTTLSLYATRHSDTGDVTLMGINKTGSGQSVALTLENTRLEAQGQAWTVQGASLDATTVTFNGQANPPVDLSTVPPQTVSGIGSQFSYLFPPYSVTALTLPACRPTDITCDRRVDIADIQICAAAWQRSPGQPGYDERCRLDADSDIDVVDIAQIARDWGWSR